MTSTERKAEKVARLAEHLSEHPTDYQAVVALLKAKSDFIEHKRYLESIRRRRRVAEIREQRKEKRDAGQRTQQ